MRSEFVLGYTVIGGTGFDIVRKENLCICTAEILLRQIGIFTRFFGNNFCLGFGCGSGFGRDGLCTQ